MQLRINNMSHKASSDRKVEMEKYIMTLYGKTVVEFLLDMERECLSTEPENKDSS